MLTGCEVGYEVKIWIEVVRCLLMSHCLRYCGLCGHPELLTSSPGQHLHLDEFGIQYKQQVMDGPVWPIREGTILYMLESISIMIEHGALLRQARVLLPTRRHP